MMLVILDRMFLTDYKTGKDTPVECGRHEIERIPNPSSDPGKIAPWLVLKGTTIGACENRLIGLAATSPKAIDRIRVSIEE